MQLFILPVLTLVASVSTAPQFLSFKDGKIGVNFGGYHAGVGLGGLAGDGAAGGLFAEAGTPFGQAARAGLGGAVDSSGQSSGGLYAGATAGGNVQASAGLAGGVAADKAAGTGYAAAQAGDHYASSGLGGETSNAGSSGFEFSGAKSYGLTKSVVKQVDLPVVQPVEIVRPTKKVHTEIDLDQANEVNAYFPLTKTESERPVAQAPVTIVKEVSRSKRRSRRYNFDFTYEQEPFNYLELFRSVFEVQERQPYVQPWMNQNSLHPIQYDQVYVPQPVIVKRVHRVKPHHLHKSAYVGGYFGGFVPPPPQPAPVVYKTVAVPVVQKRIDVVSQGVADAGVDTAIHGGGGAQIGYTKSVQFQRNPNFFADIFNIPIQTLKAVGSFLGNAAGSTNVSLQKTAFVQADADVSSKHAPDPSSISSSSDTKVVIETAPASKFIDDIFSIPINTLGAVNKFLENNVPARKTIYTQGQVTEGEDIPTRVRLGPHARRRANKQSVIVLQEMSDKNEDTK